jgi:hypothetical protein
LGVPLTFSLVTWLFTVAVAAHNAEEAIWLPAWSKTASKWHPPEFRFATVVLTLLANLAAALAGRGKGSAGAYLAAGYALAMLLNVLFPHLLATLALRRTMPGTVTAVLLIMPASAALLWKAISDGYVDARAFFGPDRQRFLASQCRYRCFFG